MSHFVGILTNRKWFLRGYSVLKFFKTSFVVCPAKTFGETSLLPFRQLGKLSIRALDQQRAGPYPHAVTCILILNLTYDTVPCRALSKAHEGAGSCPHTVPVTACIPAGACLP